MSKTTRTGYRVYWLDPVSGAVGSPVEVAGGGSWSITLNDTEDFSFTVRKSDLSAVQPRFYTPLSGGALLTHTAPDGIEYPIFAGVLTDWGAEEQHTLELKFAGIREIFERRTIWATLEYTSSTLGDIAWALCEHGMDRPAGRLPITHGTRSPVTGQRQRTYEAWNLSNNFIGKRWKELSEVINGPDIMLRPKWTDDTHTYIRWEFVHGTEDYPYIAQAWTPDFDTTATGGEIISVKVTSSAKDILHRVWCTGAGEGEGIAFAYAENPNAIRDGLPYIEGVINDRDQTDETILRIKAQGALASRSAMVDQVTLDFPANSQKTPLGSFFVGDIATVTLRNWLSIPDGTRDMRIIKLSGNLDATVTIDFQEAQW